MYKKSFCSCCWTFTAQLPLSCVVYRTLCTLVCVAQDGPGLDFSDPRRRRQLRGGHGDAALQPLEEGGPAADHGGGRAHGLREGGGGEEGRGAVVGENIYVDGCFCPIKKGCHSLRSQRFKLRVESGHLQVDLL